MNLITKIAGTLIITSGLLMAAEYKLDNEHTNVGFTVKHLMITNVHGKFKTYDAKIDFDKEKKTFNAFSANVVTDSVDTGIEKRDDHLRSDDFFASDKFENMTFVMTSYEADGNEGKMKGNLTIRGISKPIKSPIKILNV